MTKGRSSLALFGSRLVSLEGRRAINITLDGHGPVLPGAAKITLMVPRRGLEGVSLSDEEVVLARMVQQLLQLSFSGKLIQVIPQTPTILCHMAMIPMVLTVEVSVSLFGISHHLIGPFEEGLVLDFFQYLMHWFSEYSPHHLIVI